jgi:hypothetical protein
MMSGEIVLLSSFGPGLAVGGALLGAVAVGSLVYERVQARIAEQRRQALLNAQRLQHDFERWQMLQKQQQLAMQKAASQWQAAQAQLRQGHPAAQAALTGEQVAARGFLRHAQAQADQAQRLLQLAAVLDALPAEPSSRPETGLAGLREALQQLQVQQEQGPPPLASAIDNLHQALHQTLAQQAEWLAREPERLALRLQAVTDLLQQLLSVEPLAEPDQRAALDALQTRLRRSLDDAQLTAEAYAQLNEQTSTRIEQIRRDHENRLVEQQLQQRLAEHLRGMGYRLLSSESSGDRWAIPGGEQIQAKIQPGLRMAFQLQHERMQGHSRQAGLDRSERQLLRQQEDRWCSDLQSLLQRLKQDGFRLQVDFERQIPEESVPVVMVEEVDDILRQAPVAAQRGAHDPD